MISGDEHMAARLGLMGLGWRPARASPHRNGVRVNVKNRGRRSWVKECEAEVKERADERREMKTGVIERSDNVRTKYDSNENVHLKS